MGISGQTIWLQAGNFLLTQKIIKKLCTINRALTSVSHFDLLSDSNSTPSLFLNSGELELNFRKVKAPSARIALDMLAISMALSNDSVLHDKSSTNKRPKTSTGFGKRVV